jgi:hypothetical protein
LPWLLPATATTAPQPSALTSVAILIVAGNAIALAMIPLEITVVGAGGYLLEVVILSTVTAVGDPVTDDSAVNEWVVRVLVALVVGGMLNLIVGFVRSETAKKRSK